ncbi:MAG: hypothetical protein Q9O62_13160 [Ardenticatenia bacterium]|nr:hypothetical protein [Ardenticatenia bacterium]
MTTAMSFVIPPKKLKPLWLTSKYERTYQTAISSYLSKETSKSFYRKTVLPQGVQAMLNEGGNIVVFGEKVSLLFPNAPRGKRWENAFVFSSTWRSSINIAEEDGFVYSVPLLYVGRFGIDISIMSEFIDDLYFTYVEDEQGNIKLVPMIVLNKESGLGGVFQVNESRIQLPSVRMYNLEPPSYITQKR